MSKEIRQCSSNHTIPHRIPYEAWSNSQLSIVRHFGGCQLNGKTYKLDFKNCRITGEVPNIKYYPDLVEVVDNPGRVRLSPISKRSLNKKSTIKDLFCKG